MAAGLRSKQGYLDLHKGRGKWKSYLFKVTGSTYFHYFGDTKMAKPKEQVLLSQIKSIEVSSNPPKGGSGLFVFEVKSKNVSWIMGASSHEEMLSWMETIQPNCTKRMPHPLIKAQSVPTPSPSIQNNMPSPPMTTPNYTSPPNGLDTIPGQPSQTLPNRYKPERQLHYSHTLPHPPANDTPEDHKPHLLPRSPRSITDTSSSVQSCSVNMQRFNPHHQASDNFFTNSYTAGTYPDGIEPLEAYIEPNKLNMPIVPKRDSFKKRSSLPIIEIKRNTETLPPSFEQLDDYELMESPKKQPVVGDHYMVLIPGSNNDRDVSEYTAVSPLRPETVAKNGTEAKNETESTDLEVMNLLSKQFNPEQLEMLLEMLKKMKVRNDPETSLKNEDLGYLVHKTASTLTDKLLVTLEDDPDSYDKRPSWAKAVNEDECSTINTSQFQIEADAYNIPENEITDMTSIGHGQFGEVFKADYLPGNDPARRLSVAVKTTKRDCTESEKADLLREMAVMSCMVHPNIVKLYGVVTVNVPAPWLVLEYLPYGDLRKYLIASPKKSSDTLVKYMVDVAMGMHYIADRGLVHRDLAARNILVSEGELCKVADFGLLREIPQDDSIYYSTHNVPCPIRWMAPESIARRKFSIASDVWSFGILMWEMFYPKKIPYETMDNIQVAMKINEGFRLPTPRGCPAVVSRVMKSCWHSDPLKRPSFMLIATLLTSKVSSNAKLTEMCV